jgi:hypothetical protein
MVQITVGQAAGVIAAAIFIGKYPLHATTFMSRSHLIKARLWAPSGLTLILSGLLGDKNTATTWQVFRPVLLG